MAHEITINNGKAEIAYRGEKPWHGLGTKIDNDASIEEWSAAAGLNWQYHEAAVQFVNGAVHDFPGRRVLYRSDNFEPLSIVGEGYKIVQPSEVLEFYRDLAEAGGFTLETAGSLRGGSRVWALAKIGESAIIANHDQVDGYLLLSTSCDTSLSTQAELTSIRVVCANTLAAALEKEGRTRVRVPHSRTFNPSAVKDELGLARGKFAQFMREMKKLAEKSMTENKVSSFLEELFSNDADNEKKPRALKKVLSLYEGEGKGSQLEGSRGTAWGMLNAVTEYADHHAPARSTKPPLLGGAM